MSHRFTDDPASAPAAGAPSILHRKDPHAIDGDGDLFRATTEALVTQKEAMDITSGIEPRVPVLPGARAAAQVCNAPLMRVEQHSDAGAWNTCTHPEPTRHRSDLQHHKQQKQPPHQRRESNYKTA